MVSLSARSDVSTNPGGSAQAMSSCSARSRLASRARIAVPAATTRPAAYSDRPRLSGPTCAGAPAEVGPESLGRSLYAAGLVVAAGTAMRARDANRERALQLLMACALPPGFVLTSDLALRLTIPLHPQVYDGLVRGFDVTL